MSESIDNSPRRMPSGLWLIALPALMLVAIGWFSPNFRISDQPVRSDPLGGDFLQEYTGGHVWRDDAQRANLYRLETFREIQHDPSTVGFAWDEQKFFPAVYPPFWYAGVSPLTLLEYRVAAWCWLVLMAVCLSISLLLLKRIANVPTPLLLGLCLTTPVLFSLSSGQKGTLLLLILTSCWCLLRIGRPFAAGGVFGLIAFKPHLGLPMGLVMLAGRRWSWVLGTYATLLVLLIVSAMCGPEIISGYVNVCLGFGDYLQSGGYQLEQGFSLWSAVQLVTNDPGFAKYATASLSAIFLLATIWYLRGVQLDRAGQLDRAIAALTLLTVVVSPHMYVYDLTMLVLPVALLSRLALDEPARWQNWLPVGLIALTMVAATPLARVATTSGLQLGVVFLLISLGLVLKPFRQFDSRLAGAAVAELSR